LPTISGSSGWSILLHTTGLPEVVTPVFGRFTER